MEVRTIILILACLGVALGAEICCPGVGCFNDNNPFNHLPLPECLDIIKPTFNMFTRQNRNSGQTVSPTTVPSVFRSTRRSIFIIHGFWNNEETEWLHEMKNAFLDQGDYNVIIVGWGGGSERLWYPQSASNTRTVGTQTGLIANALMQRGLSRSNLYCIGHSLGGHTCGHAGKRTKFGRITGLDPAGPLFESYPNAAGLWTSDANFVDVLHTMGKEGIIMDFGTLKPLGHADFYPNGGGVQPGCPNNIEEDEAQGELGCSHGRAKEYFQESITGSCNFRVRQTCSNENNLPGSCSSCGSSGCINMGLSAESSSTRGKLYLETNSAAPFCKG